MRCIVCRLHKGLAVYLHHVWLCTDCVREGTVKAARALGAGPVLCESVAAAAPDRWREEPASGTFKVAGVPDQPKEKGA